MRGLPKASFSDVRPFVGAIEGISHLYNDPVMLLRSRDSIYILPATAASVKNS